MPYIRVALNSAEALAPVRWHWYDAGARLPMLDGPHGGGTEAPLIGRLARRVIQTRYPIPCRMSRMCAASQRLNALKALACCIHKNHRPEVCRKLLSMI